MAINKRAKNRKVNKWLFWTPRVLTFLFVLFISLFALDVFDACNGLLQCVVALFMHLIPSFLIIIFLIIAWKHELFGAVAFFGLGLLYIGTMIMRPVPNGLPWYTGLSWSLIIAGPAFAIGILFFLNWKRKRK